MLLADLVLPSLFFHQIIPRRNIWLQRAGGDTPSLPNSPPLPGGAAGKWHLAAPCPSPCATRGHGRQRGRGPDSTAPRGANQEGGREEEQLPRLQFDCVPPRAAFCCWFSAAAGGEPGSDPAEPSPGLCQGARTRLRRLSSHGFWGARGTHGTRQPGQAGAFPPPDCAL